ncbi:MAG: peptidylprolyl isomerase [Clostridia bacterium]|nr:peptidylprolyl isomerase [Clostridia bacterium]
MKKHILTRILAFVIALIMCLCAFCGCKKQEENNVVMSYRGYELTRGMYRFLLGQYKNYFLVVYSGDNTPEYYERVLTSGDESATIGEILTGKIIDIARTYLAGWYLFDEVYHLTLPEEALNNVAETLDNEIQNSGSRAALNEALAKVDLNVNELEQFYTISEKVNYVYAYLYGDEDYGLEGIEPITEEETVKYFTENYRAVDHILINTTVEYILDEDGKYTYDENGEVAYKELDEATAAEKKALAEDVYNKIKNGEASFEEMKAEYNDDIPDEDRKMAYGYILAEDTGYPQNFTETAFAIDVGDVAMAEENYGVHIIKRLELDTAALKDEEYTKSVLASLDTLVASAKYSQKIQYIFDELTVNEDVIAQYPIADAPMSY